jgi:hypothetical protein
MLAPNKISEQMSIPEGHASVVSMSADDEAAAQAIASALSGAIDCSLLTNSSLTD